MALRATGSGTISFGLVSIPFKIYTAASSQNVSFNLLNGKTGHRLKQQYVDAVDGTLVERDQMVKGYEFAKDQYVQFNEEELKKLESAKNSSLELVEFVPEDSVDLVYLEKAYFIGPDKGGDKAYRLLSAAMQKTKTIAVGRFWTRGREQLVLIRPYRKKGLIMHYAYYSNEVRNYDEIGIPGEVAFKDVEIELAQKLIEQLGATAFKPEQFRDEYEDRVRAAVEAKIAGQDIVVAEEAPRAQIIDLFEALKRSLGTGKDEAPASAKPPKKAEPRDDEATDTAPAAKKGRKKTG
jgi:DNA end-binding protein Ku